jgi:THO complex subunit 4
MVDYWQAGAAATETNGGANGAAQPAAGGDANMDDEILVCVALTSYSDGN